MWCDKIIKINAEVLAATTNGVVYNWKVHR